MRRDEVPIEDIRNAARRALSYIEAMSRRAFLADNKTRAATLYEIAIMGEAASRVSEGCRADHPEMPWNRLIAHRNFYIHVYDAVNPDIVWMSLFGPL